ncbi:helix-turn-helix transcriptional regulator [Nocardia vaccinii]|uniref:helix-turn-helix transcriptional regulator n=1 Tax=Nocardia vaccinii TaxID=1822 RepID=UPI0014712F29|nr:AAA family ATPase [Nocardia vaccinii]
MQETTVLVGRDAEIEALASLAARAIAGQGVVALVEGEAGIGKTALLEAVTARYAAAGLRVRRGAADELRRDMPFAAVCSWLDADRGAADDATDRIRALLRGTDGGAAATHEFAVSEAILEHVDTWCSAGPVALILDDTHWADRSSLAVLHRLGALADDLPLVVLLAARPLPRDAAFAEVVTDLAARRAPRVRLGPLTDAATTTLVGHLVRATPGPGLLRTALGVGGNPLYITELVAALLRDGSITVVADTADPTGITAEPSLSEAISQRLDTLSRPVRDVLPMAAALGPVVHVTELAAVLGNPILETWATATEAIDGGLLVQVNSELVFRHDVIRQVLAERLPASLRSDLLRRAGQVLQQTDAPIERVAYYLSRDDRELDGASLDWLVAVADTLIVRAPDLAVRLLTRAATTTDTRLRPTLIRLQAKALLWNGSATTAESVVRSALSAWPAPGDDVELRWLLAQACHAQGRMADAVAVAEEALSTMRLGPADKGRMLGMAGLDNFFLNRLAAAEAAGRQALQLGESAQDPLATGWGLITLGAVRYTEGYLDEAVQLSGRIPALFENGTGSDQFDPYILHAHCLIELGRFAEAEQRLTTAIRHNRSSHGVYLSANLVAKARLHLLDGRWDDALAECTSGVEAPDVLGYALVAEALAALIGIHRGTFLPDPDTVPAPDGRLGSNGYAQFHPWVNALVHETTGNSDLALKLLLDAYHELTDSLAGPTLYYTFPDIARLAADVGDDDAARTVTAAADALVARRQTPARTATALLCRGMAERDATTVLDAARSFARARWPLHEAQSHENAAVLLAASGRVADARAALDTAVEGFSRLGAAWDSARAVARVRPYGIRRGVRGPRNRPKFGWPALTETERKVAALVAEGFSNSDIAAQMFLSRRTIQSHVSNILAKLGIRSRREVAAAVPRAP